MENSMKFGSLMAVFAVSGSMAFLVHQFHKRLLSNFMKKFEHEMDGGVLYAHCQKNLAGPGKHQVMKKVRFAKQALELDKKSCCRNVTRIPRFKAEEKFRVTENTQELKRGHKLEDMMPPNRAVLYTGIMKYRNRIPNRRLRF